MTPAAAAFQTEIRAALEALGLADPDLEMLVLLTGAHESGGFKYRRQVGGGPARGLCQQEPARLEDLHDNYIAGHHAIAVGFVALVRSCGAEDEDPEAALEQSDRYAAGICALQYHRHALSFPLPAAGDLAGQADYWKRFYNSRDGKGTIEEFKADAARYVLGGS